MAGNIAPRLGQLLNPWDRFRAWLDPEEGLRRVSQRYTLERISAKAHEAATPSRMRKFHGDNIGPNAIVQQSALAIRTQIRHIVRNNDIARGIVRTMVNNVVGANGIGVEPTPRRMDGTIHEEYAAELMAFWKRWCERPEVQRRWTYGQSQRRLGWAWFRDGEAFQQDLIGYVPGLVHSTEVPYSIELFEADLVPLDYNDGSIVQGIEHNAWGQATGFWVWKGHPLDQQMGGLLWRKQDLKRIDASRVAHLAFIDHISQARGISEFASIIGRLEDIKDYEESERIAAKIAASLTAYIKKDGGQDGYDANTAQKDESGKPIGRDLRMSPGMIFDGLAVGEEIGLIDSKRPNPNVVTFRQGQLRAAAAGIGASYSSISKSYDGTFSAQRQELVEQWVNYAILADDFTGMEVQPTYKTAVQVAHLSGALKIPKDVKPGTEDDALFTAQAMPWIDPLKEASAWILLCRAGLASEYEVLRKRGVSPRDFLEQVSSWRKEVKSRGLVFTSDASNDVAVAPPSAGAGDGGGQGNDGQPGAQQD